MTNPTAIAQSLPGPIQKAGRAWLVARRHRQLDPSDALVVSYPKSGSTWLRLAVTTAVTGHVSTFDSVRTLSPPIDDLGIGVPILQTGGRLVRSHEPLRGLYKPFGRPVVYIVRDGRDVAVSLFHHIHRFSPTEIQKAAGPDLDHYIERFLQGVGTNYGTWRHHTNLALRAQARMPESVLVVRYEDALANPTEQVGRILEFLGESADDSTVSDAVAHHTADRMRKSEADAKILGGRQGFVRAAKAGEWRSALSGDAAERLTQALHPTLMKLGYGV